MKWQMSPGDVAPVTSAATLTGDIHGGKQAIADATVSLLAAGTTGYGSDATLFATTSTSSSGSFSFSKGANTDTLAPTTNAYGCPTASDPLMYLTVRNGNTTGSVSDDNPAVGLILALGRCSTIGAGTHVQINEATTVATMVALQQYFNPNTLSLGAPSTVKAQAGLDNAFAAITTLVDPATGNVNQSFTPTSTVAGVTMAATPEFAKVNTIADILATCVNSTSPTSAGCNILFTNAVPPSPSVTSQPGIGTFNAPTNTLAALYYMLTNPTAGQSTDKMSNLASLVTNTAPFQPNLGTTAPGDWTVGVLYTPSGTCTNASDGAFSSTSVYGGAVDADGNFWFVNNAGSLAAVGPQGAPIDCQIGNLISGKAVVIDASNNIYITNNANIATNPGKQIYRTTLGGTPVGYMTTATPYWGAISSTGDFFYETIAGLVYRVPSIATASPTVPSDEKVYTSTITGSSHYYLGIDPSNRVWLFNNATATGSYQLTSIFPSTDDSAAATNGYLSSEFANKTAATGYPYNSYGAPVFDHAGNVIFANGGNAAASNANVIFKLTPSVAGPADTAVTATSVVQSEKFPGGLQAVRSQAVDGAGNIWSASNYQNTSDGTFAFSEVDNNLNPLSPSGVTPSTCGSGTCWTNGGFLKAGTARTYALGVDASGNVWSAGPNFVYKIIGAAVPVVTPLAYAASQGTYATKP